MQLITVPFAIAASWASGSFQHLWQPPGAYFMLPVIWPSLVVAIKRWHDRDKSGWWCLINFIPVVGTIWAFVENGCLEGTTGDNRFGPDPLAQKT